MGSHCIESNSRVVVFRDGFTRRRKKQTGVIRRGGNAIHAMSMRIKPFAPQNEILLMHNNGPHFGKTLRSETFPLQDASIPSGCVPCLLDRTNRPFPIPPSAEDFLMCAPCSFWSSSPGAQYGFISQSHRVSSCPTK
jgi:hypothetical protein